MWMQKHVRHLAYRGLVFGMLLPLSSCATGCGWLLFPEGEFSTGCPGPITIPLPHSDLAGTWSGLVTVTVYDAAANPVATSEEVITVEFDEYGRPVGNTEPWPSEWPNCFVAGARLKRITTVCDPDPWRIPPQQDVETVEIRKADIAVDSVRLVWHRTFQEATCPEGHLPPIYDERDYQATLDGDVLNWTARFSAGPRGLTGFGSVIHMTGQLRR